MYFLFCKILDGETNSFIWIKLSSLKPNLKLKWAVSYLTSLPLCKEFARGVNSQCCYTLLQLRYLSDSLVSIKRIQIGENEIKIVDFADDTTIFLTNMTCLNRMHVIFKLYKHTSSLQINFSKTKSYGLEHIKIELINQNRWNDLNFPLKHLELILVTLSSITPVGTK